MYIYHSLLLQKDSRCPSNFCTCVGSSIQVQPTMAASSLPTLLCFARQIFHRVCLVTVAFIVISGKRISLMGFFITLVIKIHLPANRQLILLVSLIITVMQSQYKRKATLKNHSSSLQPQGASECGLETTLKVQRDGFFSGGIKAFSRPPRR